MAQRFNPGFSYPRYMIRGKRIMLIGIVICLLGAAIACYGIYQLFIPHVVGIPQKYIRVGLVSAVVGYLAYWFGRIVHWYYWR